MALRSNAIMAKTVALSPEVNELASQLQRRGVAEVLDASDLTRALYASDASLYRVVPQAVARPRTIEQTAQVLDAARAVGMPVTTRGAGTSCAGNAVGPGFVPTELVEHAVQDERFTTMMLNRIPMGRFGTPLEIAGAVLFLVSPSARHITGQVISVDGASSVDELKLGRTSMEPTR